VGKKKIVYTYEEGENITGKRLLVRSEEGKKNAKVRKKKGVLLHTSS